MTIRSTIQPFDSDIAIIGIACRFPGADDPGQFWSNLLAGVCSIGEVPADRWPIDRYYSPDINEPGKSISKWGGWVNDIRAFDHSFFNISPREAAAMDPQQRLLMEEVWHCIEDSGVPLSELSRKITSAYVGVMSVNYGAHSLDGTDIVPDAYGCSGAYECMLANRLSYWFGLRGSSQPVNTACSSSLVALHEAKKALMLREADFALVAGVGVNITPYKYISFSKARMLSPDGLCKTFDKDANGYVPGEGAGVLLLRRLSDAIRAGNRIYGVVKGTAVNHGGRANSLTAPRVAAQRDLILSAWRDAQVHPDTISYIEAHGTGTSLGDPIEVEALTQAYRQYTKSEHFCGLGSVKTNIGHLEAAAGIAGLIKVLLMMRHKTIAPTLHIKTVNPMINFAGSPFEPALSARSWEPEHGPVRRAGISSFGFGGVNAHVVIEEYVPAESSTRLLPPSVRPVPFVLSAKSGQALTALADQWRSFVRNEALTGDQLEYACRRLTNRPQFTWRFGALITSRNDLLRALNDFSAELSESPRIVLRIGEADSQVLDIVRAAKQHDPLIAGAVARCEEVHRQVQGTSDIAAFAALYALSKRLLQLGGRPFCIAGEGTGRLVSLVAAGCISLREAITLLSGQENVRIGRRKQRYAFYDRSVRTGFWCDEAYVSALMNGAEVAPEEARFYVEKARALVDNQFTFRRYLDEWNRELDIYGSLAQWTPEESRGKTRLLVIALASCLRRLSKKWGLPEAAFRNSATTELLDLLTDEVLTISDTLSILREKTYAAAAQAITSRVADLDEKKSYPLLRSWSERSPAYAYLDAAKLPGCIEPDALNVDIGRLANASEDSVQLAGKGLDELVLECWRRGVNVNWRRYGWGRTTAAIDLPSYPFHPEQIVKAEVGPALSLRGALSPALQTRLKRQSDNVFTRTVNAATEPIVGDHVIDGRILVPGALMVDMILESAGAATVSSVAFISAAAVDMTLTLTTEINAKTSRAVVKSESGLVCTARFGQGGAESPAQPERLPHKPWQSAAWLYERLREFGYLYGERLQVIRDIRISDEYFLCDLEEQPSDEGQGSKVSPYLLDGVFQCAIAAGLAANSLGAAEQIYVPYLIDELRAIAPLQGRCRVLIRRPDVAGDNTGVRADIAVFDSAGAPVLSIRQLFLKRIPRTAQKPALNAVIQVPVWQAREHSNAAQAITPAAIVIGGPESFAKYLSSIGTKVHRISAKGEELEIALAERVRELNASAIYYLNCLDAPPASDLIADIRDRQDECLRPLLHVARALLRRSQKQDIRVIAVTQNAQSVLPEDAVDGFADAGIRGLGKVLSLESKKINFTAVDLDEHTQWIPNVIEEARRGEASDVAYRNGVRYVRELSTIHAFNDPSSRSRGGVYIVTGGAGGIGAQVCRKIAETYKATVVVLGRSELKPEQAAELAELRSSGLNVWYARGDVSQVGALRKTLDDVRAQYGPIRGVIHCAGVLEDKLIVNKDWASFERVLTPKVYGVCALDALTKDDPLEVFAVFSSVVSLFGNVGQSDYAAANSFLDSFVHYRNRCGRPGRSVGINWTLWTGVGMGANDKAATQIERMGIRAIDHENALNAFVYALNSPAAQVAVLGPEPSAAPAENGEQLASTEPVIKKPAPGVESRVNDALYSRVAANVAKTLSCSVTDLDSDTDFTEYGMDSVAVITLVAELEDALGLDLHHSAVLEYPTLRKLTEYISTIVPDSTPVQQKQPVAATPAAGAVDVQQTVQQTVLKIVASALGAAPEEIDIDTDLTDYGLDSVGIMTIVSAAEDEFQNVNLHHSALVENNTVRSFAAYVAGEITGQKPAAKPQPKPIPAPALPAPPVRQSSRNDIAVIGMACRFPKSPTLEQYWANLTAGNDLISPVPAERWNVRDHYDSSPGKPKKTYSACGGFMDGIDQFDAAFFRLSDAEAVEMDPQQRIFMELTQELLDRSGYTAAEMAGTRTAIMIGAHESEYGRRDRRRNKFEGKHGVVNVISNMIAGRVADHYDFRGPAETIYTACSSSLVSIHHACQMLRHGDCDMAIAGGIELLLDEEWFIGFSQSRVLSPDGKCFVFDERANGFVLAEGAGAVLLKPLEKALADGDQVFAVIRGSAINNDGRTMGLTTPNMKAQKAVIKEALIRADIHPEQIGYYEAHGTATALGDPIEIKAATEVFRELTNAKGYCAVGSVKSNMGHALAAAGIAGFIKLVLTLHHRSIPQTLNCDSPHARFEFEKSPFFPVTRRTSWPSNERVNAAGISSFGFGGTNCHIIATRLAEQYSPARKPLPLTQFNRKRYWLSNADEQATAMKLRVLFEQVASGKITQKAACTRLQSAAVVETR